MKTLELLNIIAQMKKINTNTIYAETKKSVHLMIEGQTLPDLNNREKKSLKDEESRGSGGGEHETMPKVLICISSEFQKEKSKIQKKKYLQKQWLKLSKFGERQETQ